MAKKAETEEEKKAREVVEAIAANIEDLAKGVRAIINGRLNKRALVLLITSAAGKSIRQEDATKVLDAIATLDKTFLK